MNQKCFKEVCGFSDRNLMLVGIPLASLIISMLLFNEQYEQGDWGFISLCIPMSLVYTSAFWFSMRWSYYQAKKRYPAVSQLGRRIFWVLLALLVFYGIINLTLDTVFHFLIPAHSGQPSMVMEIISTLLLTGLVITIYEAMSFYLQLEIAISEKSELERRQVQSQLEGLRNQVNPHFLFNSLNTLIYLIPENSDKAVSFVQKLSKVYRYLLENKDAELIPLKEELDYLQAYIFLLRERFGENLQVEIADFAAAENVPMVPLTLQMLFENVIKHNVISSGKPLNVQVYEESGYLVVRNNLQRKNQVMDSTGVGLENIRERYRLLLRKEIKTEVTDTCFSVFIPLKH